ncbi:hypothetical protein L6R53_10545 [Myxococcota bacterium]|nr:hypothetical protein [Myxococcota bacterium]
MPAIRASWLPSFALPAAGLGLAGVLACGDKPIDEDGTTGDGGADGGTSAPECGGDEECADWEICEGQACVDGDRSNSADEAVTVLWDSEVGGYLNPAGDVDWFVLSAEGGEHVRLRTVHEYGEAGGDTVMTLRDGSGKILTTSDDYPTGGSTSSADSTIYAYLPAAGDYLVEVQDQGTWDGSGKDVGDPDFAYTLSVESWGQHTEEPDDGAAPSLSLDVEGTGTFYAVGVALEEEGDVDAIELSHGLGEVTLWVYGIQDLPGSEAEPSARLWRDGEEVLFQKEGLTGGGYAYAPFLAAGTYTLELYDADLGGGADHWFYVFPILFDSGDSYPLEVEANDSRLGAQALDMVETTTGAGSAYAYGQVTGHVDAVGDEDWFSVQARPDAELVVCLSSALGGSLVAPDLELYDEAGELVASGAGSVSTVPNARIEGVTMGSGAYTLRVVDDEGAWSGAGAWYRVVVYTADFDVASYEDGGYACPS